MVSLHEMTLPRVVVVGEGLEGVIVERLSSLEAGRYCIFMLTSPTPYSLIARKIESEVNGRVDVELVMITGQLSDEELESLGRRAVDVEAKAIVGVGGGRVLDVAKAVAELSGKPFISIPTVASHDGIASPMTSVRRGGRAYSRKAVMPTEIIADMKVISQAPRRYTLSGCGDLVAKYSAVRDWWLGHKERGEYYGRYAAHLAYLSSIITMRSAQLIGRNSGEGVRTVVEALISAGVAMGIAGSSRPCSGSEHLIAHALEYMMDNPPLHGERCGVATVFTSYLHGVNWRKVKEALKTMGAPSSLKELKIDEELFADAVAKAPSLRVERYTILHKLQLGRGRVKEIVEEIGLVD
ncbi:MAG TPA: iron-containing alcohol dehydrogenase [Candidatus Caldiarchaeum subterraneum]|uniref:Glycerol-1-phosphate dehydrogenase [NAD(P)+] n=1 Tax=Caldiarchaeum subterraneum TaxID=311458 RepID=A0A832ZUZ8_CALS0|nr:iron-containing alcohol dehydrogenase [Aigarchaeota archaeon]HIQ29038.1 iron-containing alcohol dehydrogenase [Candidatus Caldarchaeum subterraneum]